MNGCYSRLLQESDLATRQPQGATSVIQAITGEGLARGPYVAARGGVEPTTFRAEGTYNLHLTIHAHAWNSFIEQKKGLLIQNFICITATNRVVVDVEPLARNWNRTLCLLSLLDYIPLLHRC